MNLLNGGGPDGLGGELYHLLPAGLVGPAAFGCSREMMPAFWWQKGQVPAANFGMSEKGMGVTVDR